MTYELKPCPFCGYKPNQPRGDGPNGQWVIHHDILMCPVLIRAKGNDPKDVAENWNHRAEIKGGA